MINETRRCFHAAEALKIHTPEIKRKGPSPESFRNTPAQAEDRPGYVRYGYFDLSVITSFTYVNNTNQPRRPETIRVSITLALATPSG